MIAILVWTAAILWCGAVLFLVSLPFVFGVMFLAGKSALARKWWAAIKPKCRPNDKSRTFDYYNDPTFGYMAGNIYHKNNS